MGTSTPLVSVPKNGDSRRARLALAAVPHLGGAPNQFGQQFGPLWLMWRLLPGMIAQNLHAFVWVFRGLDISDIVGPVV